MAAHTLTDQNETCFPTFSLSATKKSGGTSAVCPESESESYDQVYMTRDPIMNVAGARRRSEQRPSQTVDPI
jgi:hypothetical protein